MPHSKANLLLLKSCYRKKPFQTEGEAYTPHHNVYHCPFCKTWHRASKPEHKERIAKLKQTEKEELKKSQKKNRSGYPVRDSASAELRISLAATDASVLFCRTTFVPPRWRSLVNAIKAERKPFALISMSGGAEPLPALRRFVKDNDIESYFAWVLDADSVADAELHEWAGEIEKRLLEELGWR